ncbi:MAG: Stp1/IreP family PP2C-type Ser/Thr phosphatase [Bacteroidales bacterium]|nr:Stp1/IreP family PP2C-type Ser/Thr phosphatase [Bacteroidales bacterium]
MSEHYNVSNVNLEAYGLSVTGQVRKANEDSCGFATVPNGDLFVVCDGMGGHVGGATASKIAVEQIIQHFKAQLYDNVYQALADALCRANIQILGEAAANPSLKGMGTTACIVLVAGNDAYIAHVGDSRIYLYEAAKKRLFRITKDHSFVQSLVDLGQLDDRDAEHHPRKNVIMKALGTKETLKPEVYESPVQPAKGDMFLICSDGLSGMVDDNGIEAILSSNASVEEKTDQLVANANVPGKGLDNITAQLIKVIDSPYPSSNHPDHNPRWRNELFGEVTQPVPDVPHTDPVYNMAPPSPQPKKRMSPKWIALIIVGALLLLGGGLAFLLSGLNQPDLETIEEQITQTEQKITETKESIQVLETEGKQEDGSYKRAQEKLDKLESKLNTLNEKRDKLLKSQDVKESIKEKIEKNLPDKGKGSKKFRKTQDQNQTEEGDEEEVNESQDASEAVEKDQASTKREKIQTEAKEKKAKEEVEKKQSISDKQAEANKKEVKGLKKETKKDEVQQEGKKENTEKVQEKVEKEIKEEVPEKVEEPKAEPPVIVNPDGNNSNNDE